jgi:small subunit ribosomal protein S20
LANLPQSKKRAKQADKRRLHNASRRTEMRTHIKAIRKAVESKNLELAQTLFQKATSILDKLTNKGLIHKNKAARHKSRLCLQIKALGAA